VTCAADLRGGARRLTVGIHPERPWPAAAKPEVQVTDTSRRRSPEELFEHDVPAGTVRRAGQWAVGRSGDEVFAVSRRCRHQFADLSEGSIDRDGCLVCPWHGSRYDVRSGEMVRGPRGFLGYRGPTPGYTGLVRAFGRVVRLRVARVTRDNGRIRVE
jgi:nitrite reductase/ring-hydroxylating ferredoxin subunit